MIKASDYRIGNYVAHNDKPVKVLGIYKKSILFGSEISPCRIDLEYLKPIPLTEEVLLKCGFVNSNSGYYTKSGIINNEFKTPYDIDIYLINNKEYDFETGDDLPMLSVHQLQNYFFSRTGEELEVKF